MNTKPINKNRNSGFTLVEMIGVLAVIAILASLLVPRVFQAIGDSKINNASSTTLSIKSAVSEYYGKYGKIGDKAGADLGLASGAKFEDWDLKVLVAEGFAEKPYAVRIGNGALGSLTDGSRLRIVNIQGNTADSATADDETAIEAGAYNLDGASSTNDVSGVLLVEAVIEGVDLQDARAFNDRIDGTALGSSSGNDSVGRVKYFVTTNNTAKVRVYLAHK